MAKLAQNRLCRDQKVQIQTLFFVGFDAARISNALKLPEATVRYWQNREIGPKSSNRAAKPLTAAEKRRSQAIRGLVSEKLVKNGKRRPRYCSARAVATALARDHGVEVSRWTVRRDLVKMGYKSVVRKRVPTVYAGDHERRLEFVRWARRRQPRRIVFSDEKIFTCNDYTARQQWVTDANDADPREQQRFCDRLMIWGAIGHNFFVWKVLDNAKSSRGNEDDRRHGVLNADGYKRKVLPLVMKHLREKNLYFQQDGAKAHTAKTVINYLRREVKVLEPWPARSPDLNPIETLWALLAKDVAAKFPQNREELRAAVEESCRHFRDNRMKVINGLVDSFRGRCEKVFAKGGAF